MPRVWLEAPPLARSGEAPWADCLPEQSGDTGQRASFALCSGKYLTKGLNSSRIGGLHDSRQGRVGEKKAGKEDDGRFGVH